MNLKSNEYIVIRKETADGGGTFLSACLFIEHPEDGWKTRGEYFGNADTNPCPEFYRFEDRVVWGVTAQTQKKLLKNLLTEVSRYRTSTSSNKEGSDVD